MIKDITRLKMKPHLEVTIVNGLLQPFPMPAPEGYVLPDNKETNEAFPMCCPFHRYVLEQGEKWFREFPLCCDFHRNMVEANPTIDKQHWKDAPMNVVKAVSYTEFIIEQRINETDWYKDITDFIEAVEVSLGMPALGLHSYLVAIRWQLNENSNNLPKERIRRILDFVDAYFRPPDEPRTDWNVLNTIYQKWLNEFPFDLPFFTGFKERFHQPQLFADGDFKPNRYLSVARFKMHTRDSLMELLVNLTDRLLCEVNSLIMHDAGNLAAPEKLIVEIAIAKRRSKLAKGYRNDSPNGEHRYRKILKAWFQDEMDFLSMVKPALTVKSVEATEQQDEATSKIIRGLNEYRFDEYHKKNGYDPELLHRLIREKAGREQLPYCIALMDETKYLNHLHKEHGKGDKVKVHKLLAAVFGESERSIRGQWNVLNASSEENRERYKAHEYKETIKHQLKGHN